MSESRALYATPLEVGQPIPRRAVEQKPVELPYLKALALRQSLDIAAKLIRSMADGLPCNENSLRCMHCQTESLADDLRAGELLLRGES